MPELEVTEVPVDELVPYEGNAKLHPREQIDQIATSIAEFGNCDPIAAWHDEDGELVVIEGHGRLLALRQLGIETAPVILLDHLTDEQRRAYALVHNQLTMSSGFDFSALNDELDVILDIDMRDFGFDLFEPEDAYPDIEIPEAPERATTDRAGDGDEHDDECDDDDGFDLSEVASGSLVQRFVVPPFTTLDARQGYWQQRKRWWVELIGDDGSSRGDAKAYGTGSLSGNLGGALDRLSATAVSLTDPVLCEALVKWFTPHKGSKVFDPFAGDTAFGFVASHCGHSFTGIELRREQCDFNNDRVSGMDARYFCDDGRNLLSHIGVGSQDMMFSCPPYFDLEVYSDLENDASNQETFEDFYAILDEAFTRGAEALADNRFAAIVIGPVRNKKTGGFYDFYGSVVDTFRRAGMCLYNDAVLLTQAGTAPIRAAGNMKGRKLVTTHQNVLVFYKGNVREISSEFPEIEVEVDADDLE
jgi:hypothetical protein